MRDETEWPRPLAQRNLYELDQSLRRLGTDYVNLYQIHRWDYETPIEETLEASHDVVKSGRVRYVGAIGHPKVAAVREHTKGWFGFDTVRRMADERVHPWPSLHRLVLCPDRELDFSVNRQTPCL
jgi:hypothetical protein